MDLSDSLDDKTTIACFGFRGLGLFVEPHATQMTLGSGRRSTFAAPYLRLEIVEVLVSGKPQGGWTWPKTTM
jgi:hypothetical protein